MKRIILSGRSGSGKTVALRALEDAGFYCVDNIPLELIPALIEQTASHYSELAVGVDTRNFHLDEDQFETFFQQLQKKYPDFDVIFIDADDKTLLKRFSETRRRHPLTAEGLSLAEAIKTETRRLAPIARHAQLVIDTTEKSPHALREVIHTRVIGEKASQLSILFKSFGFKHGAPSDADFVFDARCLPNPYWEESLRSLTGRDQPIIDFLEGYSRVQEYFWQLRVFLQTWIPVFEKENRAYLTIAIGCTGGQHRSVYIAEKLAAFFKPMYPDTTVQHREMENKN